MFTKNVGVDDVLFISVLYRTVFLVFFCVGIPEFAIVCVYVFCVFCVLALCACPRRMPVDVVCGVFCFCGRKVVYSGIAFVYAPKLLLFFFFRYSALCCVLQRFHLLFLPSSPVCHLCVSPPFCVSPYMKPRQANRPHQREIPGPGEELGLGGPDPGMQVCATSRRLFFIV